MNPNPSEIQAMNKITRTKDGWRHLSHVDDESGNPLLPVNLEALSDAIKALGDIRDLATSTLAKLKPAKP